MNRVFRTVQGESVDVVSHTLDVLKECPYVEVHIGTDSQNHKRTTVYVTVIAYRYGNRGVHYILHKQKMNKIKDKWTRLWNEADYSLEVAEWLTKKVKVQVEIDLDYNIQEKYFSSKLVSPVVGGRCLLGTRQTLNLTIKLQLKRQITTAVNWSCVRVVRRRSAKPLTLVRIQSGPQINAPVVEWQTRQI